MSANQTFFSGYAPDTRSTSSNFRANQYYSDVPQSLKPKLATTQSQKLVEKTRLEHINTCIANLEHLANNPQMKQLLSLTKKSRKRKSGSILKSDRMKSSSKQSKHFLMPKEGMKKKKSKLLGKNQSKKKMPVVEDFPDYERFSERYRPYPVEKQQTYSVNQAEEYSSDQEVDDFAQSNLARLLEVFEKKHRFKPKETSKDSQLFEQSNYWRDNMNIERSREGNSANFAQTESKNDPTFEDQLQKIVRETLKQIELENEKKRQEQEAALSQASKNQILDNEQLQSLVRKIIKIEQDSNKQKQPKQKIPVKQSHQQRAEWAKQANIFLEKVDQAPVVSHTESPDTEVKHTKEVRQQPRISHEEPDEYDQQLEDYRISLMRSSPRNFNQPENKYTFEAAGSSHVYQDDQKYTPQQKEFTPKTGLSNNQRINTKRPTFGSSDFKPQIANHYRKQSQSRNTEPPRFKQIGTGNNQPDSESPDISSTVYDTRSKHGYHHITVTGPSVIKSETEGKSHQGNFLGSQDPKYQLSSDDENGPSDRVQERIVGRINQDYPLEIQDQYDIQSQKQGDDSPDQLIDDDGEVRNPFNPEDDTLSLENLEEPEQIFDSQNREAQRTFSKLINNKDHKNSPMKSKLQIARESSKHKKVDNFDYPEEEDEFDRKEFRPDATSFHPVKYKNGMKRSLNSNSKKEKSAPNVRSEEYDIDPQQEDTKSYCARGTSGTQKNPSHHYGTDLNQVQPIFPGKNAGYLERYSSKKRLMKQQAEYDERDELQETSVLRSSIRSRNQAHRASSQTKEERESTNPKDQEKKKKSGFTISKVPRFVNNFRNYDITSNGGIKTFNPKSTIEDVFKSQIN